MSLQQFRAPTDYNGYKMYLLQEPILYEFKNSCRVSQTKFKYRISRISIDDTKSLTELLQFIHPALSFNFEHLYADLKNKVVLKEPYIYDPIFIFKGYKIKDNILTPIFAIHELKESFKGLSPETAIKPKYWGVDIMNDIIDDKKDNEIEMVHGNVIHRWEPVSS